MTRASAVALAAGLAAVAGGCGSSSAPAVTGQLRQPSSVAVFAGLTIQDPDPTHIAPYVAIANTDRNDLTILNGTDDSVVNAPVKLRPLAVPVLRPALLASTSLGEETTPGGVRKADLLVVVSAGDSKLQLVQTWNPDNTIVDQANGVTYAVELPGDVLDIVPIASPPGTARLVVAITGSRLAIVSYTRIAQGAQELIVPDTSPLVVQQLAFEPLSLATVPGDPNHVYVATRDPIPSGTTTALGVAELDVSAPAGPWPARALGARGGTRLVAAAALAESKDDGTTVAIDTTAFDGQPRVVRVYAVLDEESCGIDRPIGCGLVSLDPALDTATRGHSIPDDWTSAAGERWMPYRAPIAFLQRALAIAAAPPPAVPPSTADADQVYHGDFMRVGTLSNNTWATTGVGGVSAADGQLHFVDLGRFNVASNVSVPPSAVAGVTVPTTDNRLWLQNVGTGAFAPSTQLDGAAAFRLTPGWAPVDNWILQYQGALPQLLERRADAGTCSGAATCPGVADLDTIWVALQFGGPGAVGADRPVTQVARIFHPALGVHEGDIVVIRAASVGGSCVGTTPPETVPGNEASTPTEFEMQITTLFPPDAGRPGGFVTLTNRQPLRGEPPRVPTLPGKEKDKWAKWDDCVDALRAKIKAQPSLLVSNLIASIRAQELVLNGSALGYAGRPPIASDVVDPDPQHPDPLLHAYTLQYRDRSGGVLGPDEDALAAACPLVDWNGTLPPPTCGGGTCDRAVCERAVLARKFRRVTHVAQDCPPETDTTTAAVACRTNRTALGLTYPVANGPALQFRVDLQNPRTGAAPSAISRDRNLSLSFTTTSGVANIAVGAGTVISPNGLITFDRSAWSPPAFPCSGCAGGSYRFLGAYPAGLVVDASPVDTPPSNSTVH